MIRQALLNLNEEYGSSEEDISRYLVKEFEGLPWAHASFLSHHLEKLCGNGELLRVGNERYMVNLDDGDVGMEDKAIVEWNGDRVEDVDGKRELIKDVREETSHRLEKLCGNREIICIDNECDMVCTDDCDLGNEEMSHRLNISNSDEKEEEDRALVQVKEVEVEVINGSGGVNGDQAAESENHCEEQNKDRREPLKEVREGSQNFSGQIEVSHCCETHGEIDCVNNERSMVCVDEETNHQLSILDRDEKEDQTLFQVNEREVEAINGWSGVNGDRAVDPENPCEDETRSMELSGQNKASEQRTEGSEEQNEGRTESPKEGQIVVAEDVDVAKGKLTKVARKRRGQKRKRKQKTKRQIKVVHLI